MKNLLAILGVMLLCLLPILIIFSIWVDNHLLILKFIFTDIFFIVLVYILHCTYEDNQP